MMNEDEIKKLYADRGLDPVEGWEKTLRGRAAKDKYWKDHAACPCCGSTSYSSTYLGYIMDYDAPEAFRDENRVTCRCGWQGITHDLVKGGAENEKR